MRQNCLLAVERTPVVLTNQHLNLEKRIGSKEELGAEELGIRKG